MFMLGLRGQRRGVRFIRVAFFFASRPRLNAAIAAVERDMIAVHDHVALVDVPHIDDVDVHDGPVIEEAAATPLAAPEADTAVAETVVNAAIETNVRSPIAGVPGIKATAPSPVPGGPEHADRRHDPCAGNPIVAAVVIPGPIAGGPEVSGTGADGLGIDGQSGRADADRDAYEDAGKRCRGEGEHQGCESDPADCTIPVHKVPLLWRELEGMNTGWGELLLLPLVLGHRFVSATDGRPEPVFRVKGLAPQLLCHVFPGLGALHRNQGCLCDH